MALALQSIEEGFLSIGAAVNRLSASLTHKSALVTSSMRHSEAIKMFLATDRTHFNIRESVTLIQYIQGSCEGCDAYVALRGDDVEELPSPHAEGLSRSSHQLQAPLTAWLLDLFMI